MEDKYYSVNDLVKLIELEQKFHEICMNKAKEENDENEFYTQVGHLQCLEGLLGYLENKRLHKKGSEVNVSGNN
jgi:hypothetical protein